MQVNLRRRSLARVARSRAWKGWSEFYEELKAREGAIIAEGVNCQKKDKFIDSSWTFPISIRHLSTELKSQ